MSDINLVIKIPEDTVSKIKDNAMFTGGISSEIRWDITNAIVNGTPLDKIKAEIEGRYRVILKGTPKDDWAVRWNDCLDEVLQIIDKYKAESEVKYEEAIRT